MANWKGDEETGFIDGKAKGEPSKPVCTKKRCCICCSVIIGVFLVILGGGFIAYFVRLNSGTFVLEDSHEWESRLMNQSKTSNISGRYKLVSYDDNYSDYLEAAGIPSFVVPFILKSSETLTITAPNDLKQGLWTFASTTDEGTRKYDFKVGEGFEIVMRKGKSVLETMASMPLDDVLVMESTSRNSKTRTRAEFKFSATGIINARQLLDKNIKTKKYYSKIIGNEDEEETDGKEGPFSVDTDEEEEEFWNWDD